MPNKKRKPTNPKKIKFSAEDMHELTSPGTRHGVGPFIKGLVGGPPAFALDLMTNAAYGADQMARGYADAAKVTGKNVVSGVRDIGSLIKDRERRRRNMKDVGSELKKIIGRQQGGRIPNMNQQQYPMQPMAEAIAQQGRYGDSMMVHMNPVEVEGLASLMPNGQMPINPMTGQPEAFAFLLPMLSSVFAPAAFTALGGGATTGLAGLMTTIGANSALASGIGSGLATTALTGDVKKGLASGLTSFGIGSAMGAAADVTSDAAKTAMTGLDTAEEAVKVAQKGLSGAESVVAEAGGLPQATAMAGFRGTPQQIAAQKQLVEAKNQLASKELFRDAAQDKLTGIRSDYTIGDRISAPFSREGASAGFKKFMSPESLIPTAVGASYGAELEFQDAMEAEGRRLEEERAAEEREATDLMEQSFAAIREDYPEMRNEYNPYSYSQGGIVSVNPNQYSKMLQGLSDLGMDTSQMGGKGVVGMDSGGVTSTYASSPSGAAKGGVGGSTGSPQARNRQRDIRGRDLVAPPEGYRPGFDPEHRFFQNLEKAGTDPDPATPSPPEYDLPYFPEDGIPKFSENPFMNAVVGEAMSGLTPQFLGAEGVDPKEFMRLQRRAEGFGKQGLAAKKKLRGLREKQAEEFKKAAAFETEISDIALSDEPDNFKGRVQEQQSSVMENPYLSRFDPSMYKNEMFMQEGGITDIPVPRGFDESIEQDSIKLIEQTEMAIRGRLSPEEAEIIINRFIDEYGAEAFNSFRDQILQEIVPDSQTQGLIEGQGGGMDDQIQGMIGDQQRVAVSPGEFIVPADVVSGLGDGDTDAGADELDAMMSRVRVERTGTTEQPPRLSAGGLLPA